MEDKLLTTTEAAQRLGVSKAFLERDRCYGPTILFVRVGTRAVRYVPDDIEAYISGNCDSTSTDVTARHA